MRNLTAAEITRLSKLRSHPCVSIFMPTHLDNEQRRQDPVQFKNLLRQAEKKMSELGVHRPEVLQPGFARVQDTLDWSYGSQGLAWFGSKGHHVALELDFPVEPSVHVGERYYLKPLFWHFQYNQPYYVLTISKHGARLLGCTSDGQAEIELQGVPAGLPGIRALEDHEEYLHAHPSAPGRGAAVVHGHGSRKETERDLEQFVAALAHAMEKQTEFGRPVVLAGAEEMVSMYRAAHRARSILVQDSIPGNQDETDDATLRRLGWEIVQPLFQMEREEALERFRQAQGQGLPSTVQVEDIVPAAVSGRISTLLIPAGLSVMGKFDPDTLRVDLNGEDEDLLDLAAIETMQRGGQVYLFETGTLRQAGALLRW